MKEKKYKESYSKKVKKRKIKNKKKVDNIWVIVITILAFLISVAFSFVSELIMPNATSIIALITILIFIGIGILFDIIGLSITVADVSVFNSMATKRVRGANIAVKLISNSEKAASFCNDVIGDICGIISGSAGVALAVIITNKYKLDLTIMTLIITGLIASLTIGGKAVGKHLAINKSTQILYNFSKVLSFFYYGK